MVQLFAALGRRAPSVSARHLLCSNSMIWRIVDAGGLLHTAILRLSPDDSAYQTWLHQPPLTADFASKLPAVNRWWGDRIIAAQKSEGINWLVWRPAFHLYLFLFAIAVTWLKTRNYKALAIAAPLVLHSALLLLIIPSPDFRYQYAVYIGSLLFSIPLLALPADREQ